jgi:hypothetical protein
MAIATWEGRYPDLVVVDRSKRSSVMKIRVFSGESSFRTEVLTATNALGTFPANRWALDVGSVNTATADLAIFSRGQLTGSRRTEIHLILGPTFRAFGEQFGLGMGYAAAAGRRFLIAHLRGQPLAYAVDARRRRIDALGL